MATALRGHIYRNDDLTARELSRAKVMDRRLGGTGDLLREKYIETNNSMLFWIFTVVSLIGLVAETIVSFPIDGIIKNRAGLLWGPFSPLYGIGGVAFTLALNKHWRDSALEQFAIGAVAGGLVEGTAGYLLKHLFGIVAWSYTSHPLNFWGFTSVPMMCVWGVAGLLWFRIALPLLYRWLHWMSHKIKPHFVHAITLALMIYMTLNIVMTLTGFDCWFHRLEGEEPQNDVEAYFAEHYDNDYMSSQFGALSMWADLADRD